MYKLAICDDEIRTLNQLSKIIDWNSLGFELCATFTNGAAVLDYLKSNNLDGIIADIKMPVMDGIELAEIIQKEFPKTKMILISAYRDFEYAHSAFKYDVISYVTKPVSQGDFIDALKKLRTSLNLISPYHVSDNLIYQEPDDNLRPDYINSALKFINEHYSDDISLEDVAASTFMHPGYLSQLLKKHTNESYIDYLTKIRIEKAKELLVTTDEKVAAIGSRVGYNYSQYFHKIFKTVTGVTPVEYRKAHRKV